MKKEKQRSQRKLSTVIDQKSVIQDLSAKRVGIERNVIEDSLYIPTIVLDFAKGKTYHVRTFGCQGNERDGETICGILETLGFTYSDDPKNADLVLLNTCAVRENAENTLYGNVGIIKNIKKTKPNMIFGVCGCIPQESDIIKDLLTKSPHIDLVFGTHNIQRLPYLLEQVLLSEKSIVEVLADRADVVENLPVKRAKSTRAFVNVMYGCDKFCTYCIVPYTRGKERSRELKDVMEEVNSLIKEGYKDVTLVGQNVNNYGFDIDLSFEALLEEVAKTGIERIRFTTSNPWNFSDAIIATMKKWPNIMPSVHLPAQSGSDAVLKKMNRGNTNEEYLSVFNKLKKEIPNVSVTCDIIVGFPGETQEDFEKTLALVDYCKYDNVFHFIYSPRQGTPASKFEDNEQMEVKQQRLYKLTEHVRQWAKWNNENYVGKTVKVLVEGPSAKDKNVLAGYTDTLKLVNFTGNAKPNDIVEVEIVSASINTLNGKQL